MLSVLGEEPVSTIPKALDQLYDEHHAMVFRAAYRIAGNVADAEDVLQTVFLRVLRRDAIAEIDNPESYLRRSAVNAALDIVRARHDSNAPELDRLRATGSAAGLSDLRDALRRALAKLPGRHAEMFVLRFIEGYTNPEIARMLRVSPIAVAVTLHRTRRKLQQELGRTKR